MRARAAQIIKEAVSRRPLASALCAAAALLLTGLALRNQYGALPAKDWNARNLQNIHLADSNNFCFAVFGDNKNSHLPFQRLLDSIDADPEIAFAIVLGDTVFDGELEKFRYFIGQVQRHLHKPLLTVLGNHETEDHGRGLYSEIFGPFYYSFELGNTAFLMLDDANEQGLDLWQRNWLEKELRLDQSEGRQTLVFFHVPLFDPRHEFFHHCLSDQKAAENLQNLFVQYQVSHLFCSHIHAYFQGQWGGVPYTLSGGAGAELAGGLDPAHYFYHYLKVRVRNGALNIEVHRMPSPDYDRLDRLGSVVWLYLYAFLRIHGIETALLLIIGYLLVVIFRSREKP